MDPATFTFLDFGESDKAMLSLARDSFDVSIYRFRSYIISCVLQVTERDLEEDANYNFLKSYIPSILSKKGCVPNLGDHQAFELQCAC